MGIEQALQLVRKFIDGEKEHHDGQLNDEEIEALEVVYKAAEKTS